MELKTENEKCFLEFAPKKKKIILFKNNYINWTKIDHISYFKF